MEQKKLFRQKQLNKLADFDNGQKDKEDQILFKKMLQLPELAKSQTIGVTSSLDYEVDTSRLIAYLWDAGKDIYLAKAHDDAEKTQDFIYYTYMSKLVESSYGVEEVLTSADDQVKINNDLDLIIVPGIAFTADTHQRVGFGGGYYDRFLAKHPDTKTVAMANSKMSFETAAWTIDQTDIPIQVIVTPEQILRS